MASTTFAMFSHENAEITEGAENAEGQSLDKPVIYIYLRAVM
jgi:hypothetical protein